MPVTDKPAGALPPFGAQATIVFGKLRPRPALTPVTPEGRDKK